MFCVVRVCVLYGGCIYVICVYFMCVCCGVCVEFGSSSIECCWLGRWVVESFWCSLG